MDLTLKNIVDWGVDAVADHPVFYIHDELAAAFPHATVLLSTRNATEWAIRRSEEHSHQMVCSEAPTRGWPITEGDGLPLPHPFAIVACVERFARLSAARRSERPVFTYTGTARRDFLADGLEAFNAHVRASAPARGAPFAEIDIFAEPAATLFDRVEALLRRRPRSTRRRGRRCEARQLLLGRRRPPESALARRRRRRRIRLL